VGLVRGRLGVGSEDIVVFVWKELNGAFWSSWGWNCLYYKREKELSAVIRGA